MLIGFLIMIVPNDSNKDNQNNRLDFPPAGAVKPPTPPPASNNKQIVPYTYKPITPVVQCALLPHERKAPPRAEFFTRDTVEVGGYEEQYLNSFELSCWNKTKNKETKT